MRELVRGVHYDAVIDTQGLIKSAWLARKARGVKHGMDNASAREPLAARFYDVRHPVARAGHAVTRNRLLAAVYDLTVPEAVAQRVNVDGTARIIDFCWSREHLHRLQYVSTSYVSGNYDGEFTEDGLDEGQGFLNHYESTKYAAELLVREAMEAGLPATIYRPGIVVGDSRTGETQKYDGPKNDNSTPSENPKTLTFEPAREIAENRQG